MHIKVLDCTLRDGGYVNQWQFSNTQIETITSALQSASIDIIECGYLDQHRGESEHSTLFDSMESIDRRFSSFSSCEKVVMINYGDHPIDLLPPCDQCSIDGIRLAFHKKDITQALQDARSIKALGYKLYLQPMVTKSYSEQAFQEMLHAVDQLMPYAFYIVDSFGSMELDEFHRYLLSADRILHPDITLGYHAHNNMQLAFSNAISMCNTPLKRDIIIDASIYGMGRGAGNLNTELIAEHLNRAFDKHYDTLPLLEVIDMLLSSLMQQNPWGFSPAQYLSALFDCHPHYATYLIGKNTNHIVTIRSILERLPQEKKASFDEGFVEKLYIDALTESRTPLCENISLDKNKRIILIASGKSTRSYQLLLEEKRKREEYLLIALNHTPSIPCDHYFFSNQKRFNEFSEDIPTDKLIITDNIKTDNAIPYVLPFRKLAFIKDRFIPNIAMISLHYLVSQGIKEVEVAGLDGYDLKSIENYSYTEHMVIRDTQAMEEQNRLLSLGLQELSQQIHIIFLTPSLFQKSLPLKILGVIPARYRSSRFEGKPLCMISGIPMIKRTYTQAKRSALLDALVVATDDEKIRSYCERENIPVIMTSSDCLTGTDRIAEVAEQMPYDLYVNIQGDEPVIDPNSIDEVVSEFLEHGDRYIAYNLYKKIEDPNEINSDTIIKTIINEKEELLYMSRSPIPFSKVGEQPSYKKQVCVYGFTKQALSLFSSRNKTLNEHYEDIELLRFIDMGYRVKMRETQVDSIAVDIPEDVQKVEQFLQKNKST